MVNKNRMSAPMIYMGTSKDFKPDDIYYLEILELHDLTIEVGVHDDPNTEVIKHLSYTSLSSFLRDWSLYNIRENKDDEIMVCNTKYKKGDIADALSLTKTIFQDYEMRMQFHPIYITKLSKSYRIIRDILIDKLRK